MHPSRKRMQDEHSKVYIRVFKIPVQTISGRVVRSLRLLG